MVPDSSSLISIVVNNNDGFLCWPLALGPPLAVGKWGGGRVASAICHCSALRAFDKDALKSKFGLLAILKINLKNGIISEMDFSQVSNSRIETCCWFDSIWKHRVSRNTVLYLRGNEKRSNAYAHCHLRALC